MSCDDPRRLRHFRQPQRDTVRPSLSEGDRREVRCVTEWNEAMKYKDRISEREYQDRLENLLKNALNANLQPLRSLETATKKRRAQKKKAATDSGFTKST
jgi:hypothetical protein